MKVRIASAGTGKTTSLVLRYLELIGGGVPVRRIAGVTFTRAAAGELRQRVHAGIGELLESGDYLGELALDPGREEWYQEAARELEGATLTTIHGFMAQALRLSAPLAGLEPDLRVLPEWEARELFEEELSGLLMLAAAPEHELHEQARLLGPRARELMTRLFAQRSLVAQVKGDGSPPSEALAALFAAAYRSYRHRLGSAVTGPGELERQALALTRNPVAMGRLCERYRVVLVDEFQDVNPLQGAFFEALEGRGPAVEVVGDPKQSIYGFRNADVSVFYRARERGEELPALTTSYRHRPVVNRFLNRLTERLAAKRLGFGPQDAPAVVAADVEHGGSDAGRVEVHWVTGDEPLDRLRQGEAIVVARRLLALHEERGVGFGEMAVLAPTHRALSVVESALDSAGVPAVLAQGRGYYERIEVRDVHNALRVGVEPAGRALLAWLRGPFAGLPAGTVAQVMRSPEPLAALERLAPPVAERLRRIGRLVLLTPVEALEGLLREPLVDGASILEAMDGRQRENVDALLFSVARRPPASLELLLERLDLLSRQAEEGDVPQSGDGVSLLTVHGAKGLEWRAVAVYDLNRGSPPDSDPLRLDPRDGTVSLPGGEGFERVGRLLRERQEAESFRQLYVAASRPSEFLLLSGSVRRGRLQGWSRALDLVGLGPSARAWDRPELLLERHRLRDLEGTGGPRRAEGGERRLGGGGPEILTSEWAERSFPAHPLPPTLSPSKLGELFEAPPQEDVARPLGGGAAVTTTPHLDGGAEPVPTGSIDESELPGRATTVGTLVHYAISQSWRGDSQEHLRNLRAQEVMFPFEEDEQEEILSEVSSLLEAYWSLLGTSLPDLGEREVDEAELPMALPLGHTVFQGIIDRLYLAGGRWYLEDYKTDREVDPSRYHGQLAAYARAVRLSRGVTPVARLVYLRSRQVLEVTGDELERAYGRLEELTVPR